MDCDDFTYNLYLYHEVKMKETFVRCESSLGNWLYGRVVEVSFTFK